MGPGGEAAGGLPPVVLHHGFVANADANWVAHGRRRGADGGGTQGDRPGRAWTRPLGEAARPRPLRRAAHGARPRRPDRHDRGTTRSISSATRWARSCRCCSRVATSGCRRLVIGGVGSGVIECGGVDRRAVSNDAIIEALSAEDPSSARSPAGASPFAGWRMRSAPTARRSSPRRDRSTGARSRSGGSRRPRSCSRETPTRWRSARRCWSTRFPRRGCELLSGNHIEVLGDQRFKQSIVDFLA